MLEFIKKIIDFVLHIDAHLSELIAQYGTTTYAILFAIIFVETGVVLMPFLPGDSLLFAAGAFAGKGDFNIFFLCSLLTIAAILGDSLNYSIGVYFGPKVFKNDYKWLNKKHLEKTQQFYEKYGSKTIIIARFIPIVRTFAPFVAGVGSMDYKRFITYNIVGGVVWVWSFGILGYFFGNLPYIKKNFTFVIIAIIILSIMPAVIEVIRARFSSQKEQ
ncbi:MAG: DedA family protein [Cytophagales bacterium]|nr:MAG: DedA family protein [Cytophagales bacterium]